MASAAGGRFLLTCGRADAAAVLDLRTGATTVLPNPFGQGRYEWFVLGSRYVDGQGVPGCRFCVTLYEIATGTVTVRPETYVPDLDASGAPQVCPRLRKRVANEGSFNKWIVYSHGMLVRNTGPTERPEDVVIARCSGHDTTLRCRCRPVHFALGGGWVTWDTAPEPSEVELPLEEPARLYGYSLVRHRRTTWRLPQVPLFEGGPPPIETGVFGYAAHTATRVFWIAAQSVAPAEPLRGEVERAAVYSAPLR